MTPEEVQDLETGSLLRHEPTGLFYVVVNTADELPQAVNLQSLDYAEDWKLVRRAGEVIEGWKDL